jgi:hypothetical protein
MKMIDQEQWTQNQIEGLQSLAALLRQSEVNFYFKPPGPDMGYIEMAYTPRGPHAIYDPTTKTFDIWKWGRKRPAIKHTDLTVEAAAEILITEYFMAKAKRARKHLPRNMTMTQIIEQLRHGYQRGQSGKPGKIQ